MPSDDFDSRFILEKNKTILEVSPTSYPTLYKALD